MFRITAAIHRRFIAIAKDFCFLIAGASFLFSSAAVRAQDASDLGITQQAAVSETAHSTLARARGSVVQIKGLYGRNVAQAFHGSGFAVAPGGVLVSNYHVVAEHVLYPDRYRLEYQTPDGATGKITVLAVDVEHDLALLRAEGTNLPPLALRADTPGKGERAYSIGFPLDVGLTITEGVLNGQVEDSFDPRLHYSGAINAGMSGGPSLDASGKVVGVNVSAYRFEQLVSFLVPAQPAQQLIDRWNRRPLDLTQARNEVARQLRQHSDKLLAALSGELATQQTAGYHLPAKLARFVDCNAAGDTLTDTPVQTERIACSAKAGLYVQQGMFSGDIDFGHQVMTTTKLGAWRFAQRLKYLSAGGSGYGLPKHVAPFACKRSVVRLHGMDADLMLCVRAYRLLDGLYDMSARVSSRSHSRQGFSSNLYLSGVTFEPGLQFVNRYVEVIKWTR